MTYPATVREEELKNKVAADLFPSFDCTSILGNVDFCVRPSAGGPGSVRTAQQPLWEAESLLWAEAKNGVRADFAPLFAQLVLTIGGERTFERHSPPPFLGAFDSEKIAFVPWHAILDLFFRPDIDWTATPSNADAPAFRHVLSLVRPILDAHLATFHFGDLDLPRFIRKNLYVGNDRANRLQVTRNNFPFVYQKWVKAVKPSIAVNWEAAKRQGILDADFFLADLLSKDNATLMQKLFVVLRGDHYNLDRKLDAAGFIDAKRAEFNDGQKAHAQFWNQYKRPPRRAFWDFINERRDLLMPADIRERQGSFFTPQIWVEKAQEAIAAVLGEDWQDSHYVWDCAAGTGNLLAGLDPKAKYRVWASTLQQGDVDIMHERIRNGAALLDSHVFQFDFLNDPFDRLPDGLREIVSDPGKRRKLVVFINPPYAEAASTRTKTGTGAAKKSVARKNAVFEKYGKDMGGAANELFAQFFIRIHHEIAGCKVGMFSTLKALCAPNFERFRIICASKLKNLFLVPADTFDNVSGQFPIGFQVFDTDIREPFAEINATVFDRTGAPLPAKSVYAPPGRRLLMDWLKTLHDKGGDRISFLRMLGSDVQNTNGVFLTLKPSDSDIRQRKTCDVTKRNILPICVYFAVRHCIEANWLNDRDQFLWPSDTWKSDTEFQLDCLVFTLFHGQNRISCKAGANHCIPFTEDEVGARDCMKSHFMAEFLGKCANVKALPTTSANDQLENGDLRDWQQFPDGGLLFAAEDGPAWDRESNFAQSLQSASLESSRTSRTSRETISPAAQRVLDAGRELWRYYHAQPGALPDASFYDIRAHFQGFKPGGHMNPDSSDAEYTRLVGELRAAMKALAAQIATKVREHGFLK